jgi:ABC-type uncharacterized transport system ATPase subunit
MTEKGRITMTEFKMVVERFEENQKKITEVMLHEFRGVKQDVSSLKEQVGLLHEGQTVLKGQVGSLQEGQTTIRNDVSALKGQVASLQEGQTAIRSDLRRKVHYDEFEELEKRVTRLESKVA